MLRLIVGLFLLFLAFAVLKQLIILAAPMLAFFALLFLIGYWL